MISEPGAAMLDAKLFVSRLDGAFPDLYERLWDGSEWVWVDHGRPGGVALSGAPGAAMLNRKLFVVAADGNLWERVWTGSQWVWEGHGRPGGRRIVHGPGAAMLDAKLFVVTDDGSVWERHWRSDLGRWVWFEHGLPGGSRAVSAPGAAMMNGKFFITAADGALHERWWNGSAWVWVPHGQPPGTTVATGPGAAMMASKLFVGGGNGHLYERFWNGQAWVWVDHGAPPGTAVAFAPGAAMQARRLFVSCADGRLFERQWDGTAWVWIDHGQPPGGTVGTAPGAAMLGSKLFVGSAQGHLFERVWDGTVWHWVDHGTPRHDDAQHVLGAPGPEPKLTIAVMGDGYAEADLPSYRQRVQDMVLGALQLDAVAGHQAAFRVVRIDVVSVDSGVGERRYNADGSVASDQPRLSRLGIVPNASWDRGWFDRAATTDERIEKLRRRFAPDADHVVVLCKSGTFGGVSGLGSGVALFTEGSGVMLVAHELGHNLFTLDDEYVDAQQQQRFERTSPFANTSEGLADWSMLKWAGLVKAGAPVPADAAQLPAGWDARRDVSAFEGAGGRFRFNLFRPALECRMNTNGPPWCPVCARKIADDVRPFE